MMVALSFVECCTDARTEQFESQNVCVALSVHCALKQTQSG